MYEAWFDDFVIFMSKLFAPVHVLRIKYHTGSDYLDPNDWEQLIKIRIPYLLTFDYEYHDKDITDYADDDFHTKINRFTSQFWIKHQWFFEFGINIDEESFHCSIHPYRNIWLDIYKHSEIAKYFNKNLSYNIHQEHTNNSSLDLLPIIQLCINSSSFDEQDQLFMNKFKSTFLSVPFTRLKISCEAIPIGMFVRIIHLLSNLDSLKVSSLSCIESDWLVKSDGETSFSTSINSKITNVNLDEMINLEQVHFLLHLCPCIQYFQVNISKHMNLKMLVRFILIQASTYNFDLRFLCLSIQNANEDMVRKLQKLIDTEKLLSNYMIKCIGNHILLKSD
ncbi:unnamed protein product [Rotaria sp. Silwood1]|nr:unnamed protein product [Rotaria sp. Silwood1]